MEKMLISGVAADKNVAKIRVAGLGNEPSSTFRLLNLLDKNKLNIDVMIQSLGKDGTKSDPSLLQNRTCSVLWIC